LKPSKGERGRNFDSSDKTGPGEHVTIEFSNSSSGIAASASADARVKDWMGNGRLGPKLGRKNVYVDRFRMVTPDKRSSRGPDCLAPTDGTASRSGSIPPTESRSGDLHGRQVGTVPQKQLAASCGLPAWAWLHFHPNLTGPCRLNGYSTVVAPRPSSNRCLAPRSSATRVARFWAQR